VLRPVNLAQSLAKSVDPQTTIGAAHYLLDTNEYLARALRARGAEMVAQLDDRRKLPIFCPLAVAPHHPPRIFLQRPPRAVAQSSQSASLLKRPLLGTGMNS
jgi:hypothetical protein